MSCRPWRPRISLCLRPSSTECRLHLPELFFVSRGFKNYMKLSAPSSLNSGEHLALSWGPMVSLISIHTNLETLVDMHAKLNTVVRYYDKMLEDRLQTTYSQATYQEARRPAQSPLPYQYNLPPQSPSSPSHQSQGYFPSRRSTFSDQVNAPPASVTGSSSTYYGPSQPPSQYPSNPTWTNGTKAPSSKAPYAPQYAESAGYQYSHPAASIRRPSISDIPPSSPQQSRERLHPEYPAYSEQEPYYQEPPQRREDSSLIDL